MHAALSLQTPSPEPSASAPPVFAMQNFSVYYGERPVLRSINLSVQPKRILAVIGPSGCGKSTLLRSLNRLNSLVRDLRMEGELLFEGQSVLASHVDPVALRQRVGMVFQKPTPFPMSIFDNVAYGLRVRGLKNRAMLRERVEQSLCRAALWEEVKDHLQKPALALSGGQQQRLCIARTLAVDPQVVLFDEPTSSLDPHATARIEQLIADLGASFTIVLVTHNLAQAARLSDQTAFLLDGQLIEIRDTTDLFQNPQDPRTEQYLTGAGA